MSERVRLTNMHARGIRFPQDLVRQVHKARQARGQTFQAFVQTAIEKELAAITVADEHKRQQQPKERAKSKGLGIRERLEESRVETLDVEDDDGKHEKPSPSVVVHVNGGGANAGSVDLPTMARMVIATPAGHARKAALKSACDSLALKAASSEQALALAEQLDEEIKRLDVPRTALERVRARTKK